jgi:hypothetical protein
MAQDHPPQKWWHTIPGFLTAMAAIITAVAGLIIPLYQAGYFDTKKQPVSQAPTTTVPAPEPPSPVADKPAPHEETTQLLQPTPSESSGMPGSAAKDIPESKTPIEADLPVRSRVGKSRCSNKTAQDCKVTADNLIEDSTNGLNWSSIDRQAHDAAKALIGRHNSLIDRAKSLCRDDEYVKFLERVDTEKSPDVAASKVKRLAEEISVYMESLDERKALKHTASNLIKRGSEGEVWVPMSSRDVNARDSLVWEVNYLIRRAKKLFGDSHNIQGFAEIEINKRLEPSVAAKEVKRLAEQLERALTSL